MDVTKVWSQLCATLSTFEMPSPSLVPLSLFAAGLTIGVGASTLLSKRSAAAPVAAAPVPGARPVVDIAAGSSQLLVASELFKDGFPGPTADILKRTAYVAAYDRRLRHPAWTAEHLTAASLAKPPAPAAGSALATTSKGDRSKSQFQEDESIPEMFRAKLKDYFRSGYDRGHMVPAADAKISQQAMDETFFLSNIAPQVGDGFNRHYWAYLEEWCRKLTVSFDDVYVFTIPLYLPALQADGKWRVTHEVIGSPPSISVPTHFAKVVLASRGSTGPALGAFVLPNSVIPDEADLRTFIVPVDVVEKAAGLTLFSGPLKAGAKHLCGLTNCQVVVRRFDDARKSLPARK